MKCMLSTQFHKKVRLTDSEKIKKINDAIDSADAIVIGAGAGLSTSAGFTYGGERFRKYFSDFEERYGFHDMYSGGFYPYNSLEEYWAYWSRYIYVNRYMYAPKQTYQALFDLVKDKDYFVLTTNVDHCFQKAGFDKKRLFYTQGDYGLFQCSEPCYQETYANEQIVLDMVKWQKDMRIPSDLIPLCPHCHKPLTMNLRSDNAFVEDEGWHKAAKRYSLFLQRHRNLNIVYLELGVGYNTPGIIKYPFWKYTSENARATYICINRGQAVAPDEISSRTICLDSDIDAVINELLEK